MGWTVSPMRWTVLAAAMAGGCGGEPAAPAGPPAADAPRAGADWLTQSPLRADMRAMWADCSVVANQASRPAPDFDRIECAAEDIVRKSERFAALWAAVQGPAARCATQAAAGEWDRAWQQHVRLWKACCDCHVAVWSPARQGLTFAALETWAAAGTAAVETPWIEDPVIAAVRQTPAAVQQQMKQLNEQTVQIRTALDGEAAATVAKAAEAIDRVAAKQAAAWRAIAAEARAIQRLAEGRSVDQVQGLYGRLRERCVACHAKGVRDGRAILDPLEWK